MIHGVSVGEKGQLINQEVRKGDTVVKNHERKVNADDVRAE